MDYFFLGLLVFGGWWLTVGAFYWFVLKRFLRELDNLEPGKRAEIFKTRRQRNLK